MNATVLVLGDLGRSPRMQYHARALADHDVDVDVVAYEGHASRADLSGHPRIALHLVRPAALRLRRGLPRFLYAPAAAIDALVIGARVLGRLLGAARRPDLILAQTPPALPTLAIAALAARLRAARLVLDWHNFTHSLLALRLGARHPLVRLVAWCEGALGRLAGGHLCVSRAMREELATRWRIDGAAILYDRPAEPFRAARLPAPPDRWRWWLGGQLDVALGPRPPALLVGPTSWTEDEDSDLLLAALHRYDARDDATPLVVLMTGDGPRRREFEARVADAPMRRVQVRTRWLAPEQYPLLLAQADLGLCLHRSASGVDLPMKVADMLGAGLPVCALDYGPCLAEQVRPGENGVLFSTAEQLAGTLADLLGGFPERTPALDRLREGLARSPDPGWEEGWAAEARPVLLGA